MCSQIFFILSVVGFLVGCASAPKTSLEPRLQKYALSGDPLQTGGFSGLIFSGKAPEGHLQFITHTDRGPNGEPLKTQSGPTSRPFLQPQFQPHWQKLETNTQEKTLVAKEKILLTGPQGQAMTGLPPKGGEWPVDTNNKKLAFDPMGLDCESIGKDDEGFYWMGEEYYPSILKFAADGKLVKRFIPQGSLMEKEIRALNKKYGSEVIVDSLPESFRHRKSNRGFEGLTFFNGKIYAIVQSPLEISADQAQRHSRIVEFNVKSEKPTGEYYYPFTRPGVDKIGDLAARPGTQQICTIEQNGKVGKDSVHVVTCFELPKTPDKTLKPELLVDLVDVGYDFAEKVEGLSFIDAKTLAVVNDNDFGVTESYKTSILGVIHLQ